MIDRAVNILKMGGVVAAHTETVYGLFADATNDCAIKKIYEIKGRPSCNPLIVHVSEIKMAHDIADIDFEQERIMQYFWHQCPAPITFVLNQAKHSKISKLVSSGLKTVALRCPQSKISIDILKKFDGALAAPSANKSNFLSPTSAEMVKNGLGDLVELIVDGPSCLIGLESTILDISRRPYVLLRHGGVSREQIEMFTGCSIALAESDCQEILSPGMMKKHYSPRLPLRINAAYPLSGEAFVGFGECQRPCDVNLSVVGDLNEAAQNLFCFLQKVDDEKKYTGIAIMPIPNTEIGIAINDRLKRASA